MGFSLPWSLLWNTGSRCVGFSSCDTWAWLLHRIWNLPGPGIKPLSPALAGGFLTTGLPGKFFCKIFVGVELIYNVVLVSGVWQSESNCIHTYIHAFSWVFLRSVIYNLWVQVVFFYFFLFLYWSIVDLQCCVFRCITKWFSCRCIYIYSFSDSFPL